MTVTENIAKYVKDIGVNLSELSRKSGVSYQALYASLSSRSRFRELRANELTDICFILKINPMDFADKPEEKKE
ncbi:MAG: helix-turn-helix domain-containing protein [Candidatus Dojkabacteria bacterium]|nr:helix-turn-helix domain-containing protein [Candidatus Dojkabacteria bacterium]